MFPYDDKLLAAVQGAPKSVDDVIGTMQTIDAICSDGDGLKWFNWLYLGVTRAVGTRVAAGGFRDAAEMAALDVQFAGFILERCVARFREEERRDAGGCCSSGATGRRWRGCSARWRV